MSTESLFGHFLGLETPHLDALHSNTPEQSSSDGKEDSPTLKQANRADEADGKKIKEKKLRRRLQNRRAAKVSRARKKAYVTLLENKTTDLQAEVERLKAKNKDLEARILNLENNRKRSGEAIIGPVQKAPKRSRRSTANSSEAKTPSDERANSLGLELAESFPVPLLCERTMDVFAGCSMPSRSGVKDPKIEVPPINLSPIEVPRIGSLTANSNDTSSVLSIIDSQDDASSAVRTPQQLVSSPSTRFSTVETLSGLKAKTSYQMQSPTPNETIESLKIQASLINGLLLISAVSCLFKACFSTFLSCSENGLHIDLQPGRKAFGINKSEARYGYQGSGLQDWERTSAGLLILV